MATSERLRAFGTTIFSEMTKLALEHGAINLAQGFPDFDGPRPLIEAVQRALGEGHNQYARSMGHPALVEALAAAHAADGGHAYAPQSEVVVTSGATEAIASAMFGLLEPGDEVVLFEPFYDSYPAAVIMAGGVPRYVTLRAPDYHIERAALEEVLSERTRIVLLNTPHNPSGRSFSAAELEVVAELARARGLIVISDEVYEHLWFDAPHRSIALLPGMRERTLRLGSAGKSFSFTGWKIGWAMGPAPLIAAVQAAHQFVTFASSTATQVGLARGLASLDPGYFEAFRAEYRARRDFLVGALAEVGFEVRAPEGTYFVLADFSALHDGDDRSFARALVERCGVAAIPPSVFMRRDPEAGKKLVRFAFCKRMETLEAAAERLHRWR